MSKPKLRFNVSVQQQLDPLLYEELEGLSGQPAIRRLLGLASIGLLIERNGGSISGFNNGTSTEQGSTSGKSHTTHGKSKSTSTEPQKRPTPPKTMVVPEDVLSGIEDLFHGSAMEGFSTNKG